MRYVTSHFIVSAMLFCLSQSVFALTPEQIKYFTIQKMTVTEVSDNSVAINQSKKSKLIVSKNLQTIDGVIDANESTQLDQTSIAIDAIINIGQKIWTIVKDGQPVVSAQTQAASAMPDAIKSWTQLAGWQPSQSKTFKITYQNGFGMNVVDFSYRVIFTYGGSFKGQGRFLAGVTIIPAFVSVAWGYTFESSVAIPTIVNIGTQQNPISGMQMNVNWKVSTVLFNEQQTSSYFVDGLGRLKELK